MRRGVPLLVPKHAKAITVEEQSLARFHVPLLAQIAVVQRDATGLSVADQARTAQAALALDKHCLPEVPSARARVPHRQQRPGTAHARFSAPLSSCP